MEWTTGPVPAAAEGYYLLVAADPSDNSDGYRDGCLYIPRAGAWVSAARAGNGWQWVPRRHSTARWMLIPIPPQA